METGMSQDLTDTEPWYNSPHGMDGNQTSGYSGFEVSLETSAAEGLKLPSAAASPLTELLLSMCLLLYPSLPAGLPCSFILVVLLASNFSDLSMIWLARVLELPSSIL